MPFQKWSSLPCLALTCILQPTLHGAQPAVPDWKTLVGTYPQLATVAGQGELAILHWLQDTRTSADVARAALESKPDLRLFLDAMGSPRGPSNYPATDALLHQAKEDMKVVVTNLKTTFARPRPYTADPTLVPALTGDGTYAFPSRHATEGVLFAALLIQLAPSSTATLLEEGRLIGYDRTMAGLHWPSDVTAGQRLGTAYAPYWMALPENQGLLQAAYGEWPTSP